MRTETMFRSLLLAAALTAGSLLAPAASAQEAQPLLGDPLPGLGQTELDRFQKGFDSFNHIFSAAEGLGPVFNDSSCGQCHAQPKPGGFSSKVVNRAAKKGPPFDPLTHLGGPLFQQLAIPAPPSAPPGTDCSEHIPPEADVFTDRLTPQAFGAGLIASIDDNDILFFQNNPPSPHVSGIARMVQPFEGGPMRVGKFGWKAGVATMLSFSADASLNEMGITNRFLGQENAPNGDQTLLALCDVVPDPEDGPDAQGFDNIDRQADFQNLLAPPPQTPKSGMAGEAIFKAIGCADCHVDKVYVTNDPNAPFPFLNGQSIKPYSDFLLHDMGALGDGMVEGVATETMIKTPPLWGLRFRGDVSLLHDGRATGGTFEQNVEAAILWHDGEAAFARNAYAVLPQADKDKLFAFLRSLGRAEFDIEENNSRDVFDWFFLEPLFTGPGGNIGPDDPGAIGDANQDGSFDMRDYVIFMRVFTGPNI